MALIVQRLGTECNLYVVCVHTKNVAIWLWVLLVVDVIACGLFLIFKMRLWLIRGVGTAWSDEETDYSYKRLLEPEQSKMLTDTRASPSSVSMVVKYDYVRSRLDLLVFSVCFFTIGFKCPWMWLTVLPEF